MIEKSLYSEVYDLDNLIDAWINAKKGKTKRRYVKRFYKNLRENLFKLREELIKQTYHPNLLKTFILRDPKTRKISKSAFRDRVVHHAVCRVIVPIFQKGFIYDCHANILGKGVLKAIERFKKFQRKVTLNYTKPAFCLKADIKHYFEEIDHKVLIQILGRKIKDDKVIWLIQQILNANFKTQRERE
jgi:RNA-directed DNA polymerase